MRLRAFAITVSAAISVLVMTEAMSQDLNPVVPMTRLYVAVPLDARSTKEQTIRYGLSFQGREAYQAVNIDASALRLFSDGLASVEGKYVIAAGAVLGVGVAAFVINRRSDNRRTQGGDPQGQQNNAACGNASGPCNP